MRMRKKPWAEAEIADNKYVVQNVAGCRGAWQALIGNGNPIHVEIGMGKGRFIIENANIGRDINFIGLERQLSVFASAAKRIRESNLENIRIIYADACSITDIFTENEVSKLYINFCDPWPKSRCEKRRLTHANYLSQYKKILKPEGKLIFKTDNEGLFDFTLAELKKCGWIIESFSRDIHGEADALPEAERIMTEYEMKFSALGSPIYRIVACLLK